MHWGARLRELRRERPPRTAPELWKPAMSAGKASASALALLVFTLGIALDDLHLFRLPMIFVGAGVAVVVFAFGPPAFASRLARRARADDAANPLPLIERGALRQRAILGLTVAAFVLWLILFSSGRTPRWA